MVPRTALLQHFPAFLLAYRKSFGRLCAFFHLWSLGQRSFSFSPRFYTLIGRPLAGCARLTSFGGSVSDPLAFPCVSTRLSAVLWLLARFSSFGPSVSAPLAFPRVSTRLSAVLWLVVRLFPLMVPRTALLQHFPAFLLAYRKSFGRLCAFFHLWSLGQRSFSFSPRFYTLIGRPLAGCARFTSFAPLAFPHVSTRLSAVLWLVARV